MHRGQRRIRSSRARFRVVACGRRFGKTLLGSCLCIETAIAGGVAWWVAPDYPRATIGWRMMLRLAQQFPGVKIIRSERMIEFPGGGFIQVKSASDPDTLRGEGLDLVVIDECADVAEVAWEESLSPALTDKRGGALFIGTPKGRNWFYRLWRDAHHEEDWAAFQMPTHANPYISRAELRRVQRKASDRVWRQEFLAEFVTFEGRVYDTFDPAGPMVFGDLDLSRYVEFFGGIDFGFRNPTAMVVGGRDRDGVIDVIDEVYAARLTPEDIVESCRDLTARRDVLHWWGDASDPRMIDVLQTKGLPVSPSPRTSGSQDTFTQYEVRLVDGLLSEDPPALRFYASGAPTTIDEHDRYHYPKKRVETVERETPVKVDDHSCNAVQYMIHGITDDYGGDEDFVFGGQREAWNLPR